MTLPNPPHVLLFHRFPYHFILFIVYLYPVIGKLFVFFCFHCISTPTIVLKCMTGLDEFFFDKLMITYYKNAEESNT